MKKKFPRISEAKLTAGLFNGPQIREILKHPNFDESMQDIKRKAWHSFKSIFFKDQGGEMLYARGVGLALRT